MGSVNFHIKVKFTKWAVVHFRCTQNDRLFEVCKLNKYFNRVILCLHILAKSVSL